LVWGFGDPAIIPLGGGRDGLRELGDGFWRFHKARSLRALRGCGEAAATDDSQVNSDRLIELPGGICRSLHPAKHADRHSWGGGKRQNGAAREATDSGILGVNTIITGVEANVEPWEKAGNIRRD